MVLSHGQHQHLIKPKDKHGPRSTAELISSPGSISQLPSICPNTNLLFFTGKTREHQNNAVRSMLLGLFKNMIIQRTVNINYHVFSVITSALNSHHVWFPDMMCSSAAKISERKREKWSKKDTEVWKEKDSSLVNIITITVCLSVSLTL